MNIKKTYNFVILFTLVLVLSGCANSKFNKPFKHNTPLIKTDIKKQGKAEVAKTVELGPKPISDDTKKLQKRKKISSEIKKNYLTISSEFPLLKQIVTLKYKNLEYKEWIYKLRF